MFARKTIRKAQIYYLNIPVKFRVCYVYKKEKKKKKKKKKKPTRHVLLNKIRYLDQRGAYINNLTI